MSGKKLEEEKVLFNEYLHQNGLKKTRQKDLILDTFLNNEGHLSVEDIYTLVRKRDKKVGIVTVFRTLKSLTASGIAKEIALGDGLTRFEHSFHHPIHHHIVCTECYKVIEFLSPELERIQQGIVTKYKFQPRQQRIQIHGVCQDCREQRTTAEGPKPDTGKVFARDAMKMALTMQQQVVEFYRLAAGKNRNASGRAVFESAALEEEAHALQLGLDLDNLQRHEKGLESAPEFLHFNPIDLQQLFPSMQASLIDEELDLDARRALEIVMLVKKRAAGYFTEYAEKFGDTEGKRVFQRFVETCVTHLASIRRKADSTLSASV